MQNTFKNATFILNPVSGKGDSRLKIKEIKAQRSLTQKVN